MLTIDETPTPVKRGPFESETASFAVQLARELARDDQAQIVEEPHDHIALIKVEQGSEIIYALIDQVGPRLLHFSQMAFFSLNAPQNKYPARSFVAWSDANSKDTLRLSGRILWEYVYDPAEVVVLSQIKKSTGRRLWQYQICKALTDGRYVYYIGTDSGEIHAVASDDDYKRVAEFVYNNTHEDYIIAICHYPILSEKMEPIELPKSANETMHRLNEMSPYAQ